GESSLEPDPFCADLARLERALPRQPFELCRRVSATLEHLEGRFRREGADPPELHAVHLAGDVRVRRVPAHVLDHGRATGAKHAVHLGQRAARQREVLERGLAHDQVEGAVCEGHLGHIAPLEVDGHACVAGGIGGDLDERPADVQAGHVGSQAGHLDRQVTGAGRDLEHPPVRGQPGDQLRSLLAVGIALPRGAPDPCVPPRDRAFHLRGLESPASCLGHLHRVSPLVSNTVRRLIRDNTPNNVRIASGTSACRGELRKLSPEEEKQRGLTRERLVQAALDLINHDGLDGLAMRALADRLDVKASSLYWHVRDRRELLELLAESILEGVRHPRPTDGWRQAVLATCESLRREAARQKDAGRVLLEVPEAIQRSDVFADLRRQLESAGLSPSEAAEVALMAMTYVISEDTSVEEPKIKTGATASIAIDSGSRGVVPIHVSSGVVGVSIHRPTGAAVVAIAHTGAVKLKLDDYATRVAVFDVHWQSEGAAKARDRFELDVSSGVVNLQLDTYTPKV